MISELREQILQELSPDQREVVRQLHRGPVKVVAAAGSGKTRTMAALYAMALVDGLAPGQILAVTFTNKGAAELRERVTAAVGGIPAAPDLESAWIGTFHRLMRRLLAEHWYEAKVAPELEQLDEVEARLALEQAGALVARQLAAGALGPLPPGMRGGDVIPLATSAVEAVQRLRATPLTPEQCARLSQAAYAAPPFSGDPAGELEVHRLGLSLTMEVWREYERFLAQRHATDFDGLLRTALRALTGAPPLAAWARHNFQLLIVDEYQDTSPLQARLLFELCGSHQERIFVVGDPRQSIYAFRDAQPGVMDGHPGRPYPLPRNYRSLAPILAAAEAVLRTEPHFAADAPMEVGRAAPDGHPVLLGLAGDPRAEAEGIADLIWGLRQDGLVHPDGTRQAVAFQDVAVLARTLGRIGPHLENALRARAIPFATAAGGLLDRPEVKDAVAMLRAATNPLDGQAWVRVLQGPLYRISDVELDLLLDRPQAPDEPLPQRLERGLRRLPGAGTAGQRATAALELLSAAATACEVRTASEVMSLLIEQSGLRAYHDARSRRGEVDGARALASLEALNRVALESERGGRFASARELLERMAKLEERGGRREPAPTAGDQVTLSTIHGAKGLEWPVVVLADCRPFSPQSRGGRILWDGEAQALLVSRAGGSPTAAKARWDQTAAAHVDREERTRLIYVAMTRAQDLLVVTTSRAGFGPQGATLDQLLELVWAGEGGQGEFAQLLAGLAAGAPWAGRLPGFPEAVRLPWGRGAGGAPERPPAIRRTELAPALARWQTVAGLPEEVRDRAQRARPQVSFSSLATLERCPRWYWFAHVAQFRAPDLAEDWGEEGGRAEALELGTKAHLLLERYHRRNPTRGPAPGELAELARRTGAASAELESMLETSAALPVAALPTLGVEVNFSWRGWGPGHLPDLVGAIDRLALGEEGEVLVLDYKTDLAPTPATVERHGRQLLLYSLAVEAGLLGRPRPARAALVMLRTGELLAVDGSAPARDAARQWAATLAGRALVPESLTAVGHSPLPCGECPYRWFCPEREGASPPAQGPLSGD